MNQTQKSPRIKVRDNYQPLYKDLINLNLFQQHSDFFTFCCVIGEKYGEELKGGYKYSNLFQYYTFNHYQKIILRTIAYNQKNTLLEDLDLIELAENLADKGLEYLINYKMQDFVIQNENGDYFFIQKRQDEFLKFFFDYVYNESNEAPF